MRALIAYYTFTGKTGVVAKEIKKHFNFKVWEAGIRRIKSETGILRLFLKTVVSRPVDIKHGRFNLEEYDIIFIGTPVWAGKPNSAVLSFIDNLHDCRDKNFVCFTIGKSKRADEILKNAIAKKNGTVIGMYSFKSKKIKKSLHTKVEDFLSCIKIFEKV